MRRRSPAWRPGRDVDRDRRFRFAAEPAKLPLLRFDPGHAQIWLNENSLFAGVKMLFGTDPKADYRDKVAEVDLA